MLAGLSGQFIVVPSVPLATVVSRRASATRQSGSSRQGRLFRLALFGACLPLNGLTGNGAQSDCRLA